MKRTYFWVLGYSREGKRALIGPYPNDIESNVAADDLDEPEVYELDTRSQPRATKQIKANLFTEDRDMDSALSPQLHPKGPDPGIASFASPAVALRGSTDIFEGDPFKD